MRMEFRCAAFLVASMLLPASLAAQATAASPAILPDGRVTFRLAAPKATEVSVSGDWPGGERVAMAKDDSGVWSVTVGPLDAEMWSYAFQVNGARVLDPHNVRTVRDGGIVRNLLIVPGPQSAMSDVKEVPHGTVSQVWYPSSPWACRVDSRQPDRRAQGDTDDRCHAERPSR